MQVKSSVYFLTVHDHTHILDEAVDNLKNMSYGSSSLVLGESIQPLQDRLDVLVPQKFLYKFDYVALSKITH